MDQTCDSDSCELPEPKDIPPTALKAKQEQPTAPNLEGRTEITPAAPVVMKEQPVETPAPDAVKDLPMAEAPEPRVLTELPTESEAAKIEPTPWAKPMTLDEQIVIQAQMEPMGNSPLTSPETCHEPMTSCLTRPFCLVTKKLRSRSYTVETEEPPRPSRFTSFLSSGKANVEKATRKSIHGISSAFSSIRGKSGDKDEENIYVFHFISPTLFLYAKDLKSAVNKKVAEWEKHDSQGKHDPSTKVTRHFIVDCSAFIFLDNNGATSMAQIYMDMAEKGIRVYYAAARDTVRDFFVTGDQSIELPHSAFFPTVECAVKVAKAFIDCPPPHVTVASQSIDVMETDLPVANPDSIEDDVFEKDE